MRHPLSNRSVVTHIVAPVAAVAIVVGLVLVVPRLGASRASSTRVATATAAAAARGSALAEPHSGAGTSSAGTPAAGTPAPAAALPATTPAPAPTGSGTPHGAAAPTPAAATNAITARPTATAPPSPAAAAAPTPSVLSPAAPGTYRYRQVGSLAGTPAEGTLIVAPASPSGTQTWTRVVGGTVAPSTTVMRFDAHGAYLVSPGSTAAGAASCTFAAPVPWPPWPITAGQSVSGSATCSGGISSYQVTGHVQAPATMSVAGSTINAAVVGYTVALSGTVSGSPFNVTVTETDYYAPTLRVPVLTRTHVSGTAVGIPITTDRTDTLESVNPS